MRIAILVFVLAACTTTGVPAGSECSRSSDCESGLSCLELGQPSGSACTLIINQCSLACGSNADCSSLGSGFICFPSCGSAGNTMVCTGAAGGTAG